MTEETKPEGTTYVVMFHDHNGRVRTIGVPGVHDILVGEGVVTFRRSENIGAVLSSNAFICAVPGDCFNIDEEEEAPAIKPGDRVQFQGQTDNSSHGFVQSIDETIETAVVLWDDGVQSLSDLQDLKVVPEEG